MTPGAQYGEGLPRPARSSRRRPPSWFVVFGAFLFFPDWLLKQFGLGLAVAVLLDAAIIRCLIVPAVMRLMGERAWWLPRWVDRWMPQVALEHQQLEPAARRLS